MTTHDGAQVTFVESYAQPRSSEDSDGVAPARKLAQLRPSLVIAGDVKALEVVRTVHSPKPARSTGSHSPLLAIKHRISSSDSSSAEAPVVSCCADESDASLCARRQTLFARASIVVDVVVSVAVLLYVAHRSLRLSVSGYTATTRDAIDVVAAPFVVYVVHNVVQTLRRACSGLNVESEEPTNKLKAS